MFASFLYIYFFFRASAPIKSGTFPFVFTLWGSPVGHSVLWSCIRRLFSRREWGREGRAQGRGGGCGGGGGRGVEVEVRGFVIIDVPSVPASGFPPEEIEKNPIPAVGTAHFQP